ncbi:S8/S53 family peptidase [Solwaraspora sp. WMMB335]|uniref:S8/S53 family peptidase n=1 Tax=Solwaraspora sp. WMMB335 TaxID=3404118 RepID=UPI003B93E2FB
MATSPERLSRYTARRQTRLEGLRQLRHTAVGTSRAWYVADELLVVDDGRRDVERYLGRAAAARADSGDEELLPGLRRYRAPGLDVPGALRTLRAARPSGTRLASPNHIFLSSPFNHGGPFGPPVPTAAMTIKSPADGVDPVPVTIVDTGLWRDTRLPTDYLVPGGVELETETDVDNDGLLDGDVGHANFIGGVITTHTDRAALRVIRVLDTFGVCTEADLAIALGRLHPDTKVINLSLGGFTADGTAPLGIRTALSRALSGHDRVVVAAAGNDGNRTDPFWPAAFAGAGESWSGQVVAVAAHDGTRLCSWSNTGSWVSLVAPGQDVRSTFIDHTFFPDGWALWSGTSFAAPRVAAEVAARIGAGVGAVAAVERLLAEVASAGQRFGGHVGLI